MSTIAISGFGSIGRRHADVLTALGVEVVVHDPLGTASPSGLHVVRTLDELERHPLTGLVVASPDRHHRAGVEWAHQHSLPALVEKPIAESVETGERIVELAHDGATILVGYVLRHSSVFAAADRLLADGAIGEPVSAHVELGAYETLVVARNRFAHPEPNRLFVDYSHEWDYLRWFFGPLTAIGAHAHTAIGAREHTEHPNSIDALLRASHLGITAHLDYLQLPGRRHMRVIGTAGAMEVDAGGEIAVHTSAADGMNPRSTVRSYAEPRDAMFTRQAEHFLAITRGEIEPAVTAADGLAALRTAAELMALAQ